MRWHRLKDAHAQTEKAQLEAERKPHEAERARLETQMHSHFLDMRRRRGRDLVGMIF